MLGLAPPAPHFLPAGLVQWAQFAQRTPHFGQPKRLTGRRLQGVKYERLVQSMLDKLWGYTYLPLPWLRFEGSSGVHWCQPDGILFNLELGVLTIVEVKYQHTTDAWWQMRKLYEPVLRKLFPEELWEIKVLEVVKWFDPDVRWPEPIRMLSNPGLAQHLEPGVTGVHIWKP